jgi:AbrB family looped-hinge helix DNA binding protein
MNTITVSSKYQIVIPLKIREALGIRPGEKLHAIEYRGGSNWYRCDRPNLREDRSRELTPMSRGNPIGYERRRFLGLARVLLRRA